MNSTPPYIVSIVVSTLAGLSIIFVSTLAWCVTHGTNIEAVLLAGFCGVGGNILGTLQGMLITTRTTPSDTTQKETTVTTMSAPSSEPLPDANKDIPTT